LIHHRWSRVLHDGATLHADVRLPEGPAPHSAVLLFHGFKGFKDWGFFPWLAERLVEAGLATVVPNFSCNGIGEGGTEFTDLEGFARNTFTREQEEIALLMEALRTGEMLPEAPSRIGMFGHSRGGGQAILAAERHAADALVTWAAVSTFHRWSPEDVARWRQDGKIHVVNQRTGQALPLNLSLLDDLETHAPALDIVQAAQAIQSPWLLVHGSDDSVVALTEAERLAEANARVHTLFLANAGHTMGATHPMTEVPPALAAAAAATITHLRDTLYPVG